MYLGIILYLQDSFLLNVAMFQGHILYPPVQKDGLQPMVISKPHRWTLNFIQIAMCIELSCLLLSKVLF